MADITTFSRSIDPQVQAIFLAELSRESMTDQIINRVPPESYTMTIGTITGAAATPIKTEGNDASAYSPRQGGQVQATHVVYSHLLAITRELSNWDRYATAEKLVRNMAQGAPYTMESSVAGLFNRAFNSSYTGADSIELVSRVHTLYGSAGGTTPNEIATTGTALSPTTLEEIRLIHQNQVNDEGLILQERPRFLLTGLTLGTRAKEYLGSTLRPDTANNNANFLGRGMISLEWDLISSTTSYFLLSDKSQHDLSISVKQAPTARGPYLQFRSENIEYAIAMEYVVFFVGWRGVSGAEGA